jgi:hypothetical protein
MQKALIQINLHLHKVVSDITGLTGMAIIRAIVAGDQDPQTLAALNPHLSLSQSRNLKRLLDKGYGVLSLLSLSDSLNKFNSLLHKRFCDFSFPSLTEEG